MKKAQVVIGANFGDEGKGLVTDFLASQSGPDTLVVRFNGGAQAGHTVTTPDGRRHVFGHFGSGSFLGCATLLSRFFVCNPLAFFKERAALQALGLSPRIYIEARSLITTPYDMMINQCVEEARGSERHGSCGLGFGETMERSQNARFCITFGDLSDPHLLLERLRAIKDDWAFARLKILGVDNVPTSWDVLLKSNIVFEKFLADCVRFYSSVHLAESTLLARSRHILFEGAQGLLLDEDYGWFPHVTRSSTGLKNVSQLVQEANISDLEVYYLTRSYLTRHGAGPMPTEMPRKIYKKIEDATNIPNPHQGALRFGLLDVDLLTRTVLRDFQLSPSDLRATHNIVVTCMDQVDHNPLYISERKIVESSPYEFLKAVKTQTAAQRILASFGPTRRDVVHLAGVESRSAPSREAAYTEILEGKSGSKTVSELPSLSPLG